MDIPWREARLKPEYGSLYPFLDAGVWQLASTVSFKVAAWLALYPDRKLADGDRILHDEHFEFRGSGAGLAGERRRCGES